VRHIGATRALGELVGAVVRPRYGIDCSGEEEAKCDRTTSEMRGPSP
jgi:hypothetical protein